MIIKIIIIIIITIIIIIIMISTPRPGNTNYPETRKYWVDVQ